MQALTRTPTKQINNNDAAFGLAHHTRTARLTPRAQVVEEALAAPPLRLGSKSGYRFPARSVESPSKPSRAHRRRPVSIAFADGSYQMPVLTKDVPELNSDEDTLSDDSCASGNSIISPSTSLSVTPPEACAFENQDSNSPPSLKDFLLSSALMHSSLLNDGALHDGPEGHSEANTTDILPLFRTHSRKQMPIVPKPLPHRHRRERVLKSILKKPSSPDFLNFVVTATNGSLVDATIFATEINSCSNKVPLPTTVWEKVTIPVNVEIRDKFKKSRAQLIGGYYDDCGTTEDDQPQEGPSDIKDAAVIRGYECSVTGTKADDGNEKGLSMETGKSLRWAHKA